MPARLPSFLAACAVLAGLLSSCSAAASPPGPAAVINSYVGGWSRGAWSEIEGLATRREGAFAGENAAVFRALGVRRVAIEHGTARVNGRRASVPVTWTADLARLGTLRVQTTLHLRRRGRHWKVVFTPETIDPELRAGDRFAVSALWAPRAPVLASDGSVLSSQQLSGVEIGVQGSFIKDPVSLEASLVKAGATIAEASGAIAAARASPDLFEPVFTVSTARYAQLKPTLYPIPGTVFRTVASGTPPPDGLAAVVGTLGTITASELAKLGPPYTRSSIVGQGGIEEAEQAELAGTPGGLVRIVESSGKVVATLLRKPPVPGRPVRTSIDPEIETLAFDALSGEQNEAALVALRASTGQVLAAVNTASTGTEDLALDGAQPPGSTFKVVTSTALILHGLGPLSPATCPPTITIDGEVFHNASSSDAASNMLQAFTVSCNTAYIGLATSNLGDSSLHEAAALYDLGNMPALGAESFPGSVPVAESPTDLAASAIGQGRIVVNPLDLAAVAAAVDTGTVRSPRLVAGAP
ncbi:MAG: penicillin-binding transpeptidase domain-containing protein, partial [Acidimicrobiales bacterium]